MKLFILFIYFQAALLSQAQTIRVHHQYYDIDFDTSRKLPVCVTYQLTKAMLQHTTKRSEFHYDTLVRMNLQSAAFFYSMLKGYDRGHLAPDADFRFNGAAEYDAMCYTNCAPQAASFNRYSWKALEDYTRHFVWLNDSVSITTGVVYDAGNLQGNDVPKYFWKMLQTKDKTEVYVATNLLHAGITFEGYKVSYDSLLRVTEKCECTFLTR